MTETGTIAAGPADQDLAVAAAAARAALGASDNATDLPRFELFHAANSLCSQKVRVVLDYHGLLWRSRTVDLFTGQTYLPEYVRLRMIGCARLGGALASRHSGSTSTAAGGCDGAVVPTLVDWEAGEVIVDSKRTCLYLDAAVSGDQRLRPADLAAAIDAELEIVDNLPNYQMLMGRTVGTAEAVDTRKDVGNSFSQRKVALCEQYLREFGDDPTLAAAYTAKREKELSAAVDLFSPDAMRAAYARAETALVALEAKLAARRTRWLFREEVTMADLFWGVELLRMRNVGVAHFWEAGRLPHVERFLLAAEDLPAIRAAIIDWPGAMF